MNVLQVLPRLDEGGVETGTVDFARYLTLNGHKAVVISGGGRLVKRLHEVGARHYQYPVGKKSLLTFVWVIPRIVDVIRKENIHIIHARSRVPALASFVASRITSIPFITTAHGYYRKHLISKVMGWGKFVIVASNAMGYHMIKNFGVLQEKIRLIPRGVDLGSFEYKSPGDRRNNPFTIGMISRISPIKGHSYFIQAISQVSRKIPNLKVVIVGGVATGKEKYKAELDLLIRRLGLVEIVKFLGPRDDIPRILSEMNILVMSPVEQEAFGRAIIEAQAAGVPVVATTVGGIVDIVKDGQTGLLCSPQDPKELADKIIGLAKNKDLQQKIAEEARQSVEHNFTLEKMAASTLRLYEEAMRTQNILIIKLGAIGDVILGIPSIRAIRDRFKEANIKVLVGAKAKDILKNCPYVDDLVVYDYEGRDSGFMGFLKKGSLLRKMNFDISIDLQNNRKSRLMAALSFIPLRQGYDNGKFSFLLNRRVKGPKEDTDPISHQAHLLRTLSIPMRERGLELWPSRSDEEWTDGFLGEAWVNKGQLLIGINPGSSARWSTKRLPAGNMARLCDMLAGSLNARILITGTKDDIPLGKEIAGACKHKPIMAAGKTSLMQLAALIRRCNVFVTSDSAPMHIASASGVAFVALFGPTAPERHMVPDAKGVAIKKDLACAPCYYSKCIIGLKCMTGITAEEIFEAVKRLLAK